MVSTVRNTDVRQKDADHAVVVAITTSAVFGADDGDEVFSAGVALPLLQALQGVNQRLLGENPAESLLFDVILITTDNQQQQQRARIISSTRHHGLEVSRFCFSNEEDFVQGLLTNDVQLFLSADTDEASQASERGVLSATLDQQTASSPPEQLRVLLCGDAIARRDPGLTPASRQATRRFLGQLGDMRRRFAVIDSPLSVILVTARGGRESCCSALKTLRSRGVGVDEAYCLAGAPQVPILSLLRPHFLLSDGFAGLQE